MKKYILGISGYYHDSAAVLLLDDKIVAAAQEERFTRKKNDDSFPLSAVQYVLCEAGLCMADIDVVAFYDKPFLKFERLLETYHAFAPRGLKSFLSAMPVWIKEKLFMRRMIKKELEKTGPCDWKKTRMIFPEHHLSHAAAAFYPSPYEKAAILTVDGVGEWATTTISAGNKNSIKLLREMHFPHSLGLLYSAFTYYCGFKVNSGEYKLMGLAPYGNEHSDRFGQYKKYILDELVDLQEDGSMFLNMDYFEFATGLTMCRNDKWEALFQIPKREPESEIDQAYMDLALALQRVTEISIFRMAETAQKITGYKNLVMAGGVALNCVANGKLGRSGLFKNIWIQPAAGDAGGALGAAFAACYIWYGNDRRCHTGKDSMKGSLLGPEFSQIDISRVIRKYNACANKYSDFNKLCQTVSDFISKGKVIGWFQGRMEFGPRALGNRSIIGDPRNEQMQKKLNLKIKYREGFRPFAPSVLSEDCRQYFDMDSDSPYMLLVEPVNDSCRNRVPDDYLEQGLYDRLYHIRSVIPAVTHVDFSARIQTVHQDLNPRYWTLINSFKALTGCPLVVNTSFNVRGEPIVCTPDDAYRCFMKTEMDYLVVGDFLFRKEDQPEFEAKS